MLCFCKWSNLWSKHFVGIFLKMVTAEKVNVFKGFQRFKKLTAGNCLHAPKCGAIPASLHPDKYVHAATDSVNDNYRYIISKYLPIVNIGRNFSTDIYFAKNLSASRLMISIKAGSVLSGANFTSAAFFFVKNLNQTRPTANLP